MIRLDGVTILLGEPMPVAESVGHGWFPALAQFPTGELLVTYSLAADTNENSLDISNTAAVEQERLRRFLLSSVSTL